jgi:hypothetical protein
LVFLQTVLQDARFKHQDVLLVKGVKIFQNFFEKRIVYIEILGEK